MRTLRSVSDMTEKSLSRVRRLADFGGYTVDFRLREFRKVDHENARIDFVAFESTKGQRLLKEMEREWEWEGKRRVPPLSFF